MFDYSARTKALSGFRSRPRGAAMKLTLEQLLHTIRNRLAPIRSVCGRCPVIRHPMAFIRATLVSPLLPSPGIAFLVEECTESEDRCRGFPF
jgi:hypothetical protein